MSFLGKLLPTALAALAMSASPSMSATKISVGYTAVPAFLGAFVAKEQGFFANRGLDVDLVLVSTGSLVPAALASGSFQFGAPSATVLLQANEGGLDLVITAGMDQYPSTTRTGLLARPDSGIAQAKDLVGRKVAVPGIGTIVDVLMKKWVQDGGVDYRKVVYVEVSYTAMAEALKSGQVDAVASVDPFLSRIVDGKIGVFVDNYAKVVPDGTVPGFLASTREFATKNPAVLKAFREALDEGHAFVLNPANERAVRDSLAKHTKLPPQIAATVGIPNRLDTRVRPEAIKFWITVAREQGLIKGNPDPASLIAP